MKIGDNVSWIAEDALFSGEIISGEVMVLSKGYALIWRDSEYSYDGHAATRIPVKDVLTEAQIDNELRSNGVDPDALVKRVLKRITL